jgi:tetratricopeptide (TPR) repeat protein
VISVEISAWTRQAFAYHSENRLAEAARLYHRILAYAPGDMQVLYLLGALECQRRDYEVAVTFLQQAVRADPRCAAPHAVLGMALLELGRSKEALESYDRALALDPDNSELLNNRSNALLQQGRVEEAIEGYDRALARKPDYVAAHVNRAGALLRQKRSEAALGALDRALAIDPVNVRALNDRAVALVGLRRPTEALACIERALKIGPRSAEALNNRGNALLGLTRPVEALASFDEALALAADDPQALNNRGNALRALNRAQEALSCYDRALRGKPGSSEILSNRGNVLRDLGRHEEALSSYARSLALDPDYAMAHHSEAVCRLQMGDLEAGWREYEWRWRVELAERNLYRPQWRGQSLRGKTILLHAEQGFGDTLQFCRYAKLVAAQGGEVTLEVQPELESLLGRLTGVHHLLARDSPLPATDYHCPLLSLPLAFGTSIDSIPADTPYIEADDELLKRWHKRLGPRERPRVGLAWSGNPIHLNDHNRSIPLSALLKIVSTSAQFVSLQKYVRSSDQAVLAGSSDILHFGDQLHDFSDTAALVGQMDLVITVDTVTAHLAGALGKPVWILLPFNPDWRWLLARADNPWYPSVRLFRQPAIGDWNSVLAEVASALETAKWPSR